MPKKPPVGGTPPSDSRKMVIASATPGRRRGQAGPVVDEQPLVAAVADPGDHAEGAQGREGVGRAGRRAPPACAAPTPRPDGDHADQQVAGVRDRRVGEHALDVLLPERGQVAERHGQRPPAPTGSTAQPVTSKTSSGLPNARAQQAHDARRSRRLHARGHEAGHRRGRALVGVGRPHVERHRRDLEGQRDQDEVVAHEEQRRVAACGDLGRDAGVGSSPPVVP